MCWTAEKKLDNPPSNPYLCIKLPTMKKYELFCAEFLKAGATKRKAEAALLEDLTSATWRKNRFTEAVIAAEVCEAFRSIMLGTIIEQMSDPQVDELMLAKYDEYKGKQNSVFFVYQDANEAKVMYEAFGRIASIFNTIAYTGDFIVK